MSNRAIGLVTIFAGVLRMVAAMLNNYDTSAALCLVSLGYIIHIWDDKR